MCTARIKRALPGILLPFCLLGQQVANTEADPFGLMPILKALFEKNLKFAEAKPGEIAQLGFFVHPDRMQPEATFLIGVEDASVELSLRLPDDRVLTATNAASAGATWESTATDEFHFYACPNFARWVSIQAPPGAAGEYVVEAKAGSSARPSALCATHMAPLLGREGLDYEIVGNSVSADQEQYLAGDTVTIAIPVKDTSGQAVHDAVVDGVIQFRDQPRVAARIRMKELKNGIYVGRFKAEEPANYAVLVTIAGRKQRESGQFLVNPLHARLTSALVRAGPGGAQVTMQFQVFTAGQYRITPSVLAANGHATNQSVLEDLTPGDHTVRWNIPRELSDMMELSGALAVTSVHVVKTNPQAQYGSDLVGMWVPKGGSWGLK